MKTQHSNTHIRRLAQKWLDGSINPEEAAEFAAWYNESNDDDAIFIPHHFATGVEEHRQRILKKIMRQIATRKPRYSLMKVVATTAVAATIALFIGIGYQNIHNQASPTTEYAYMVKAPAISASIVTNYNRHLTLPDGSMVVLKAGSTLKYPSVFSGRTREVILEGEAYFDIQHDAQHQFIIHTGKVTTKVLGTAFDIKAWPKEQRIAITVTRGRVRVEDQQNILATLTKNEQINVTKENMEAEFRTVDADSGVKSWTKENMTFNHVALSEVCNTLSKRYDVEFIIEDSQTASTLTYLTFNGTEPLKNILEIICMIIPNTKYNNIDNKSILISTTKEKEGVIMKH